MSKSNKINKNGKPSSRLGIYDSLRRGGLYALEGGATNAGEGIVCGICAYRTHSITVALKHQASHGKPEVNVECNSCLCGFTEFERYLAHVGNFLRCRRCCHIAESAIELDDHFDAHYGEKAKNCGQCGFTCWNAYRMQIHKRQNHHGEDDGDRVDDD